jgi:myo-inositol-1(or 4)-monophosphatase
MSDRELAERLVRAAGAVALELRGGAVEVKGAATDVVTEADRRAEAAMEELLRAERPDDGVRGEEGAAVAGGGGRSWLLDPIDGTLNYARGLPAWCSAACVLDGGGALACAVFDPVAGELFSAAR